MKMKEIKAKIQRLKENRNIKRLRKSVARRTRKSGCRSFREVLALMPVSNQELLMQALETLPPAKYVCGVEVEPKLRALNYGQLWKLSNQHADPTEAIFYIIETILDISDREAILNETGENIFGFIRNVKHVLKQIDSMFSEIAVQPTQEQVQAGIRELKFGMFGTVDWYARRMCIPKHDDVLKLSWRTIYECMKNDNETEEFNRRLQRIREQKAKNRKR